MKIKKRFIPVAIISLLLFNIVAMAQVSCPKWGPYIGAKYSENVDADAYMADVMIPAQGNTPYTYTCVIQFGLGKSGGYCGLQNTNGDNEAAPRPYNNIFSIWDYPNKEQIIDTYKAPMTFVGGFGNEGTGLHSHADFGWIPGHWYTLLVRRWYTDGDRTSVGFFIFDQTKKQWSHYVTFSVPEKDAKLNKGMSGFLENFADDKKRPRFSYYKSYWTLSIDGKWSKPDYLEANAGDGFWGAEAFGKDGVRLQSCGPKFIKKDKVDFPVSSAQTTPATLLTPPARIYDAAAYYDKGAQKLHINWSLVDTTTPQLSYKVELLDDRDDHTPLTAINGTDPEMRSVVLSTSTLKLSEKNYYIRVAVRDLFNRESESKIVELQELKP